VSLEKPNLQDEKIIAALYENYGVTAAVDFLPLGYDSNAWVYKANANDGSTYFVKLKKGSVAELSLRIPHYLKSQGMGQSVAPLSTKTQQLLVAVEDFTLILYPFIDGDNAANSPMSDSHWIEYGAVLKKLHSTVISPELLEQVPKETFTPNAQWSGVVKQLLATVKGRTDSSISGYENAIAKEGAAFWIEKYDEIAKIIARAEELGHSLQRRSLDFVLCHADIHRYNLMIDKENRLFVVDWDQPIFAPKERDLMFIVDAPIVKHTASEESLFFQGYGQAEIDWLALAYYRYEWAMQDIGSFSESIFLRDDVGDVTRQDSIDHLKGLFQAGEIVQLAYESEAHLPSSP
jgi:spectinomycin phosphotransferase